MPYSMKKNNFNIWYVLMIILVILLLQNYWTKHAQVENIPYSEFIEILKQNKISRVNIKADIIRGELAAPSNSKRYVYTNIVSTDLAEVLEKYNVEFSQDIEKTFFRDMLAWVIPLVFILLFWGFLAEKVMGRGSMQGGFMSVGKSKAKIYEAKVTLYNIY